MDALVDKFFDSYEAAREEAQRRRRQPDNVDFLTVVEPSGYGGYRVKSLPVEFCLDLPGSYFDPFGKSRTWSMR